MRKHITTALLVGALSAVPAAGFAATETSAKTATTARHEPTRTIATHATRGVVKSVDASRLVIARKGAKPAEMTFALNPATHRDGTIAVGAPVSVRYREEGKTNVATAIRVQPASHASHTMPSKG
jgi:hypothetical protein